MPGISSGHTPVKLDKLFVSIIVVNHSESFMATIGVL